MVRRSESLRTAWAWIVRIGVLALCVFLTAWSVKMAVADWRAQHNGMEGLESAIRLEPGESVRVARAALAKNANGDMSAGRGSRGAACGRAASVRGRCADGARVARGSSGSSGGGGTVSGSCG